MVCLVTRPQPTPSYAPPNARPQSNGWWVFMFNYVKATAAFGAALDLAAGQAAEEKVFAKLGDLFRRASGRVSITNTARGSTTDEGDKNDAAEKPLLMDEADENRLEVEEYLQTRDDELLDRLQQEFARDVAQEDLIDTMEMIFEAEEVLASPRYQRRLCIACKTHSEGEEDDDNDWYCLKCRLFVQDALKAAEKRSSEERSAEAPKYTMKAKAAVHDLETETPQTCSPSTRHCGSSSEHDAARWMLSGSENESPSASEGTDTGIVGERIKATPKLLQKVLKFQIWRCCAHAVWVWFLKAKVHTDTEKSATLHAATTHKQRTFWTGIIKRVIMRSIPKGVVRRAIRMATTLVNCKRSNKVELPTVSLPKPLPKPLPKRRAIARYNRRHECAV